VTVAPRNETIKIKLTNRLSTPYKLMLEPWTGVYTLESGKTFDILAEGDITLPLEIEICEDRLILGAFDSAGALLTVFQDGKQLRCEWGA
jgi:hypothetical protein